MSKASVSAQRASRLRWYLGVVGPIGTVTLAVALDTPLPSLSIRVTVIAGIPVTVAYLACAVLFARAARSVVLIGVLSAALAGGARPAHHAG